VRCASSKFMLFVSLVFDLVDASTFQATSPRRHSQIESMSMCLISCDDLTCVVYG